jgi:preprotein translocase subunit SecY
MQLMTVVIPSMEKMKKDGELGRRKISQFTRYGTVVLATFQAIGISLALQNQTAGGLSVVLNPGLGFVAITTITLVTGTIFLMWLGEQVTERGIGNGISMIIFAGIVSGLPKAIGGTFELVRTGEMSSAFIVLLFLISISVTMLVVFVERGQRRVTINYPKRQEGRKLYAGQSSFLPLKLNMAGVIPPIFASSIILFPATIAGWFGQSEGFGWLQDVATLLSPGQPVYVICACDCFLLFFLYRIGL